MRLLYNLIMKNLRVAVLRGGPSDEYEVSLLTGQAVLSSLRKNNISTKDILISRQGEWIVEGFSKSPKEALLAVDVVFIALHGSYGEDGTVQRLLEHLGIPYTGSRPYPSAVAMNKILTKETLQDSGIKMPAHMRVTSANSDVRRISSGIEALFGPEYIVKPVYGGSSIGVYRATGGMELAAVLAKVLQEQEEVLVEEYVKGREATVGIVEGIRDQEHYRLPAIEIIPPKSEAFFSYKVKYDGSTEEICPGRFSASEKEQLETLAEKVHKRLNLKHYSRSDFIVNDNGIYFLEVNTLPGLTEQSLMPKALNAVGHSYDDFILHLINLAKQS